MNERNNIFVPNNASYVDSRLRPYDGKETNIRFICEIIRGVGVALVAGTGIRKAADGVSAATVVVVVVNQSSPTAIWSIDRYNEH